MSVLHGMESATIPQPIVQLMFSVSKLMAGQSQLNISILFGSPLMPLSLCTLISPPCPYPRMLRARFAHFFFPAH